MNYKDTYFDVYIRESDLDRPKIQSGDQNFNVFDSTTTFVDVILESFKIWLMTILTTEYIVLVKSRQEKEYTFRHL